MISPRRRGQRDCDCEMADGDCGRDDGAKVLDHWPGSATLGVLVHLVHSLQWGLLVHFARCTAHAACCARWPISGRARVDPPALTPHIPLGCRPGFSD